MNKHNTLVHGNQRKMQISQAITEKLQSSRKRVRQFHQSHPTRRGRDRGRGGMRPRVHNPHPITKNFRSSFKAEAKLYSKDEYNNLTPNQNSQIHELKLNNGWLDGRNPPPGFQINHQTGRAKPNTQMVSAIRAATSNTSYHNNSQSQSRVEFAPLPHVIEGSTIGASVEGSPTPLGTSFGQSGRRHTPSSNSTVSSVTLNGRSYHGPVFDDKGNKLNRLLIQLRLFVSRLGRTPFKLIYYMFNSTFKNHKYSLPYKISSVRNIREFNTVSSINNFRHPNLNKEELRNDCKLGLDTWADTGCAGK